MGDREAAEATAAATPDLRHELFVLRQFARFPFLTASANRQRYSFGTVIPAMG